MKNRPTILFYCQHSLGVGHLVRSLALAEGFAEEFRVVLLNGGRLPKRLIVPRGIEVINLPPVGVDENNQLVSHDNRRSTERAQTLRKRIILETFNELRPAVVFVELFPFGRKKFAGELLPMLETARATRQTRTFIVCSLRDILVSQRDNQQRYDDRAAAIANEFFDLILVHSDPSFARLEDSFHPQTPLRVPVHYTGFVMPRPQACCDAKRGSGWKKIVVSAGGGMVGEPLLRTAIQAHGLFSPDEHIEMKIIGGLFLPKPSWHSLNELAYGRRGLTLRRHVSDLCGEMLGSAASVSQCGYNTTLDILRAGIPALVVPYAVGSEDEQLKRALRLRDLGAIRVLEERDVNPVRLSAEIRELVDFRVSKPELDLDGVRNSVQRICSMIQAASMATAPTGPKLREMRQVNA